MASRTGARPAAGGLLHSPNLPIVITVAAMIVSIAALLPILQSSGATTTAGQINNLQQQRDNWQAQIRELEVDVASLGSLDHLENDARNRLHMETPAVVHYIPVPAPAPAPQRLPSRYLPPSAQQHSAGASLWDDFLGWLPFP